MADNADEVAKIASGVKQWYPFSAIECENIEDQVNEIIRLADTGSFNKYSVDISPLRKKYFFGEGYTYGSQMAKKGPGMERLYPEGYISPIPHWIKRDVILPLVVSGIIPDNFVNSVVINDYLPGGCIVSHIDPPHIFDRPIVSLSLFSDSTLSFGCRFEFKPIRCTRPIYCLPLQRGVITALSGYAANDITHCIRPEDTTFRRAVIILRRVLPDAQRLSKDDPFLLTYPSPPNALTLNYFVLQNYIIKNNSEDIDDDKPMDTVDKVKYSSFKNCDVFYADNLKYLKKAYTLN